MRGVPDNVRSRAAYLEDIVPQPAGVPWDCEWVGAWEGERRRNKAKTDAHTWYHSQ